MAHTQHPLLLEGFKHSRTLKREGWGQGAWEKEPDRVEGIDTITGYPILLNRSVLGAWCGYVALPSTHPWAGKRYNEISEGIKVHGGLTYSDVCQGVMCHETEDGGEPVWWLGFDCAHAWDFVPEMQRDFLDIFRFNADVTYRTVGYALSQCLSLAQQLKKYETVQHG